MLGAELRRIHKAIDDLDRRQKATVISGVVEQVAGDRVRLRLLDVGAAGKPVLSPLVRWQEQAGHGSGGTTTWVPPVKGEPMVLVSPGGEIGDGSFAMRGAYTDINKAPSNNDHENVLVLGGLKITQRAELFQIEVGETRLTLSKDGIQLKGETISESGKTLTREADELVKDVAENVVQIAENVVQMKSPDGDFHVSIDVPNARIVAKPAIQMGEDPLPEETA